MEVTQTQPQSGPAADRAPIVNDFSITVATVNGSGSQTANNTLIRAIHKMGVPASGKNLFPSNIQGLPTWFTIRVSKDGYIARRERAEILVAMNKATIAEDIQKLESGGICLYPIDEPLPVKRDDVTFYPMPVNELTRKSGADAKLRPYVANMVYVGILMCLLDIEMSEIEAALRRLGDGDFTHIVAVSGPRDLEALGRQLDWVRLRLIELEEQQLPGAHRVVVHTAEGLTLRGLLEDPDLAAATLRLLPSDGGPAEELEAAGLKAIFFMVPAGEPPPPPEGQRIHVTFRDGRRVAGFSPDYADGASGFFLHPAEARTQTGRIWVYQSAVKQVAIG